MYAISEWELCDLKVCEKSLDIAIDGPEDDLKERALHILQHSRIRATAERRAGVGLKRRVEIRAATCIR